MTETETGTVAAMKAAHVETGVAGTGIEETEEGQAAAIVTVGEEGIVVGEEDRPAPMLTQPLHSQGTHPRKWSSR